MHRIGLLAGTLLLASCGGDDPASSATAIPACIPGSTAACLCASGGSGAQTCQATGAFAPCECAAGGDIDATAGEDVPVPPPACIPGASVACTCTSGASGAQVCQAAGLYAPCECKAAEVPDAGPTDLGTPPDPGSPPDPGAAPDPGSPADPGGPPTCIAGQSAACACTTGGSGAQVCLEDGTFGPCVCETVDAGPAPDAGTTPDAGSSLPPLGAQAQIAFVQKGDGVVDLALDATHVVWLTKLGVVQVVDKEGGFTTTLKDGQTNGAAIAVDGEHVYWCTSGNGGFGASDGALRRIAKDGDALTFLEIDGKLAYPKDIAIDEQYVYVTQYGLVDAKLRRYPKKGGPPVDIAAVWGMTLALDGTDLYVLSPGAFVRVDADDGKVTELPLGGSALALDATDAYVLSPLMSATTLARVAKVSKVATPIYTFVGTDARVAADDSRVYVTGQIGAVGVLYGFPKGSDSPVVLATKGTLMGAVAVDDSGVYASHNEYGVTAAGILVIPKL